MIEDVVLNQLVAARERIGGVALRRRGLSPVEIAVAHGRVDCLIHPDMLLLRIDAADVLEPDSTSVEDEGAGVRAAGGVVHREILNPAACNRQAVGPPSLRISPSSPVRHVETW